MLNALWLLRERGADAPQAARFIELAERAVKKLEERIRDLKALDQQLGAPALPVGKAASSPSVASLSPRNYTTMRLLDRVVCGAYI